MAFLERIGKSFLPTPNHTDKDGSQSVPFVP